MLVGDGASGDLRGVEIEPGRAVGLCGAEREHRRRDDPIDVHGGGPAAGALYSAVRASPATLACQPPAAYVAATVCRTVASATRSAVPSITRSKGLVATLSTQRGSRSMLRDLRVPGPDAKYAVPSTWIAPSGITCGLPSGLIVVSLRGAADLV